MLPKFKKIIFLCTLSLFSKNLFSSLNFTNELSRILLKDSNARVKFNQASVLGWQDRSITKKFTGRGLGDYNLVNYAGGDQILTYAEAPTELVYDNSQAIASFSTSQNLHLLLVTTPTLFSVMVPTSSLIHHSK